VDPDRILEVFAQVAGDVRTTVASVASNARRARTDRAGQYAIDLLADERALRPLHAAGFAVVSEESGRSGRPDAPITVVLDPIDGSTNCARGIPYWAISLCAVDEHGPLAALVANQATGSTTIAVRGRGATRDGVPIAPSSVERVPDAVVALAGTPARVLPWKQFRALGCAALALCDVAAGAIDGYVDAGRWHAPWDYLGGLLACREAGAVVADVDGIELATIDGEHRAQIVAAATRSLCDALRPAAVRAA
jgi:fructose-1,6-bisphosphatase/inositol monophosphatase family enzyme